MMQEVMLTPVRATVTGTGGGDDDDDDDDSRLNLVNESRESRLLVRVLSKSLIF
jgi:hypothetical protein